MAPVGQLGTATVGATIKVHLPGESPWAECIAVHDDGTWDGKILNKLFHEYSEIEAAKWTKNNFGTTQKLPKLHDYHQDQIVRFEREITTDYEIWVPSQIKQ